MKQKAVHTHIISYAKALTGYSSKVASTFDADIIHKLRTTFKKLRALLRWQRIYKKKYQFFKKLYGIAGEIRNIQVVKEMPGEQKDIPSAFKKWLKTELRRLQKEWISEHYSIALQAFKERLGDIPLHHQKNKSFFAKRIRKIKEILASSPVTDASLHDIRKLAKDMQYLLGYGKNSHQQDSLKNGISIHELKTITSQMGAYNDRCTALLLLTEYMQQQKQPAFINETRLVIAKWKRQKAAEKKQLLIILRSTNWREKNYA